MKKSILVSILALMSFAAANAREYCDTLMRNGFTQAQYADAVKRWVVANEDIYGLRIAYSNDDTGKYIVKGMFTSDSETLQITRWGMYFPRVSFAVNVTCTDSACFTKIDEIKVKFDRGGYVDYSDIPNKYLEECRREIEVLTHYITRYDSPFDGLNQEIKDRWFSLYNEIKDAYDVYMNTSDKKAKKEADKQIDRFNKSGKDAEMNICSAISFQTTFISAYLIGNDTKNNKGLKNFIDKDF